MNLIVAVDKNWGIGKDNGLLAHIPGDLKYFKEHTQGKVVVMGRRTLESMPGGKGLPNRTNIVLTGNKEFTAGECIIVHSEEELFGKIKQYNSDDVWLIGGASLYNKYYLQCDKLFITKIDAELGADTFIVNVDESKAFKLTSESEIQHENGLSYKWLVYDRK